MNFSVFFTLLPAIQYVAQASEAKSLGNICTPPQQISEKTASCMDNRQFTDYAERCLDRVLAEVRKAGLDLKNGFSPDVIQKQTEKFAASQADYSLAAKKLNDLIQIANRAGDEIEGYLNFINLPEDAEQPKVNGGNSFTYSMRHPCYAETKSAIEDILMDIDYIIENLTAAQKASDALTQTSSFKKTSLSQTALKAAASTKGTNGTGPKAGKSVNPRSDITGVKEDQEKRQGKP